MFGQVLNELFMQVDVKVFILSSYKLACVSIRANTKPKARRYARPKGGHYEGRGLCIRLYR